MESNHLYTFVSEREEDLKSKIYTGFFLALIIFFSFFLGSAFFTLIVCVCSFFIIAGSGYSNETEVNILENGIYLGERFIKKGNIRSFKIFKIGPESMENRETFLKINHKSLTETSDYLYINNNVQEEEIYDILRGLLPEDKGSVPLTEHLYLKFFG